MTSALFFFFFFLWLASLPIENPENATDNVGKKQIVKKKLTADYLSKKFKLFCLILLLSTVENESLERPGLRNLFTGSRLQRASGYY